MQDQEIIEAVIGGQKQPFKILVDKYLPMVRAFFRSMGVPTELIDDTIQETFIKVYLNLNKYRPVRPFSAWLLRVARNTMIDNIRKTQNHRNLEHELSKTCKTITTSIEPSVQSEESDYQYLLENLSDSDKLLIELRLLQKLSFQEISEILEVTENSLRVRIHRLLQKMRRDIESVERSVQ
ncbi:MAG: sigma-70 family RNA polymerase sigma factor [Candidatus Riflebacteria bacterium]|nr:sigma-70 family RNA polymerase sigma factor [Candidatus Riflebacteria bacterium]